MLIKSPQGHLSSSHPLHDQTAHRQLEPKWHVGTASTLTGRWCDKPPTRNHAISLAMFLHTFCISIKWLPTDLMLVDGLTKLGAPMMLLRRVLREGRVILQENDEMTKWAGKLQKKLKS